ncbi:MAG TPA: RDD family protein [Chitinophagaceae bacterium]
MSYQNYDSTAPVETDLFTEAPLVYGGFWERFGAAFLDGLILLIPNYIVIIFAGEGLGNVLSLVMNWLYYAISESSSTQATLGKKALGLKVITTDGQQISFGQATGRYFGKILSTVILFIGYLMMIWDEKKQTLHDKMANTLVVKR